jgi:ATP-binding protein involved in chromosome partitioning
VPAGMAAENAMTPAIHHGIKVLSVGFFVERGAAVMWRGPMIHKLLTQFMEDVDWGELDYLVVDLPPGTGDTQLSLSQLVPVTGAVMVTTPQEVSVIDVEKALAMWKKVEIPVLGIVENMSYFACPKCGHHEEIFAHGGGRALAEREGLPFLGEIPMLSAVRSGGDSGKPIVLAEPNAEVSQVFRGIARQIACALSVRNLPDPGTAKRSSKLAVMK